MRQENENLEVTFFSLLCIMYAFGRVPKRLFSRARFLHFCLFINTIFLCQLVGYKQLVRWPKEGRQLRDFHVVLSFSLFTTTATLTTISLRCCFRENKKGKRRREEKRLKML